MNMPWAKWRESQENMVETHGKWCKCWKYWKMVENNVEKISGKP
jgi:hypothetical protein